MDRAGFFCPSPTRDRHSSARARPKSDSHSNISSEPDGINFSTVHTNATFTYVFCEQPGFIKLGHQQINARSYKQALLNAQACTRRPISIFKLNDSHCKNVL